MTDKVTEIEVVSAPKDYEKTDYQFFLNKSTNQLWKASIVVQPAYSPMINGDIEAAATQLAVQVTVSPVDENGKALEDNGKPIIIDAHSHTFNHIEMSEPDFDPLKRIMSIIAERIHIGECRLIGIKQIKELGEAWTKKAKIKFSGSFKYIEPEEATIVNVAPTIIEANGQPVGATAPLVGFSDGSTVTAPVPQKSAAPEAPPASET